MTFTPTAIGGGPNTRFGFKFTRATLWIPDGGIADTTGLVPLEAEINLSTDLTDDIQSYSGFSTSPRYAELPDINSPLDGKVPDGASLDDSSIMFYLADDDDDALDFFTEGDKGFILDCPRGLVGEARAWVWRGEVSAKSPAVATSGGAVGTVSFAFVNRKQITLPVETT